MSQVPRKRKAHTKSRNGCVPCKLRHMKCDEKRPRCGRCARLDQECVQRLASDPRESAAPSSAVVSLASPSNSMNSNVLHVLDLELLHHLTTDTYATIVGDTKSPDLFIDKAVRLGFKHNYVLHSLLAVSALHLKHEHPSRSDLSLAAAQHFDHALRLARSAMGVMSEDHAIGMFIFSSMTAIFALAKDDPNIKRPLVAAVEPIDEFVGHFDLIRGVHVIVRQYWSHLERSWVAYLFQARENIATPPSQNHVRSEILSLQELIHETHDTENRQILNRALLDWLATQDKLESNDETDAVIVLVWPIQVDGGYLSLLSKRDPIALIILAHYAGSISMRPTAWWAANWPVHIMSNIANSLGEGWSRFVEWPMNMIFGDGHRVQETPASPMSHDSSYHALDDLPQGLSSG